MGGKSQVTWPNKEPLESIEFQEAFYQIDIPLTKIPKEKRQQSNYKIISVLKSTRSRYTTYITSSN